MRYKITLSYDGSAFFGWQIQPNAISVQGQIEKALTTLLKSDTKITGAGRTDTGVNAIGYICHFDTPLPIEAGSIRYKLNAICGPSIVIHDISECPEDFHSRFQATEREYTYFIHRTKDPFVGKYSYLYHHRLDIEAMNEAAELLLGTRDCSSFEKTGSDTGSSICTISEAGWHYYTPSHVQITGFPCQDGDYIYFRIKANRFLRNMVRAVVGSLLDVGRGRRSVEEFASIINGGSRCDAGESVPGHALFLSKVKY